MMNLAFAVVIVLLGASALMAVFRVVTGPTILDRMVASEVFLVTVMCGLLVVGFIANLLVRPVHERYFGEEPAPAPPTHKPEVANAGR